jgi:phosphonate transport system substrate-binding protein
MIKIKSVFSGLLLAATATMLTSAAMAQQAKTLVFSAIPDQDETRLKERFSVIADYLSKELGVPVKYVPVKSYAAAVTAFRNNQVQLAWFGGLSGVQARLLVPDSRAIAQGVEDPQFYSYLIAHHSTGLKQDGDNFPKGIAGKTFTFGSKGSTSGRLMPQHFIHQNLGEEDMEKIFKRVGFSGNHSKTVQLVASGAYEVGAVNYSVWDKELASGKIDPTQVSVIWKTPVYPDYQWTIRGDVDATWGAGFVDKVQKVLLDLKDEDLLSRFQRSGFIEATNADYQPILDVGKATGLID